MKRGKALELFPARGVEEERGRDVAGIELLPMGKVRTFS